MVFISACDRSRRSCAALAHSRTWVQRRWRLRRQRARRQSRSKTQRRSTSPRCSLVGLIESSRHRGAPRTLLALHSCRASLTGWRDLVQDVLPLHTSSAQARSREWDPACRLSASSSSRRARHSAQWRQRLSRTRRPTGCVRTCQPAGSAWRTPRCAQRASFLSCASDVPVEAHCIGRVHDSCTLCSEPQGCTTAEAARLAVL